MPVVHRAMSKITLFDTDYSKEDKSTFDYRSGSNSFQAMGNSAIRGVLYLTIFKVPGVGKVGPFLMAAAFPSGPLGDDSFILPKATGEAKASSSDSHSTNYHSTGSVPQDDSAPFAWLPGNIVTHSIIKPVLLSIRRNTRAPMETDIGSWWDQCYNSMIFIPRGNKLTHPVSMVCSSTDIPEADSPFLRFFAGDETNIPYPTFENQVVDPPVSVLATLAMENHAMCTQPQGFILPTGHCFPLGIPLDVGKCATVAELKLHLADFTGYDVDTYNWLDSISTLPVWLRACNMEPIKMAIDSFFLFDVKETFLQLAAQDDHCAERTFLYLEITIRAKTVMDHVSNSFGSDKKAWTEKLPHFLSLSLQAVNGTPLLSDYHRHHSLDCPVIFALCNPKTAGWRSKFHIPFLKSGIPTFLEAFKVLQLPGQRDNVPDSLHIFSKDEHAGAKSPQSKDKATAPVDASAILNNLFGDQFKTVSSPAHVHQDPFKEPPKKRLHSSNHKADTVSSRSRGNDISIGTTIECLERATASHCRTTNSFFSQCPLLRPLHHRRHHPAVLLQRWLAQIH
ncbi:hypothetical protein MPSEU_001007000 [Mayamaea pseudoterrestris]|nr:hypothetical protein MPSEU_001007000 [Mayamaea pseudoterrestris]